MSLDGDPKGFLEVVPKLSEILAEKLKVHISLALKGKEPDFSDEQLYYFLGYTTAYSDILAQHAGGESGGSVAISTTVNTLQNIFGNEPGQKLFQLVERCMSSSQRPIQFDDGLTGGAEDATKWVSQQQSYGIGKNFVSFFQIFDGN